MSKLTINNFQKMPSLPDFEEQVLDYWDESDTFMRSILERNKDKTYVFYDGPPFATGLPHYGHILASTIKDVVPRYWTMKGYRVKRVWGWDCHGIPIENMIEKELRLKGGKKGIEALGIDKFNAACRAAIFRFDKEWEKVIRRIGRWVDFKNSYKTMELSYMESVWWGFKTLYEKNLVYEGHKVILYCPRCATPLSNFEIAMDNSYQEMTSPSTVYKYKIKGETDTYLLAWSTTPWNKLATPALVVNPHLEYVKVKQERKIYILAKARLNMLKSVPYEVIKSFPGKELEKLEFELHYDFYPRHKNEKAGVVVADEYVTAEEGTGIVTLAVYGEDDYRLMKERGIQLVEHVDTEGKLKPEVTPWGGMNIYEVNPLVNKDLAFRGLIYKDDKYLHSVPVCYRCETRLYYAPIPAWFIDIQSLKEELFKQNEHINWYPRHLKHGRFGKGLETAPDWNISRSRYWGTPMPVWMGEKSGKRRIIGSLNELKQWAVDQERVAQLTDIHREYIDNVEIWVDSEKSEKGRRIPEVFDCWVESGSMPFASIHYPFENKDDFERTHPAQFIAEYIAQTRAWFYTLHVLSVGLFGSHTFENAVTTGTILAEDGSKMSKSKNNFPDPALIFKKYGVDALRFYLMDSVVMRGENLNFSEAAVKEVYQKVISILWNIFSFYKIYSTITPPVGVPESSHILDKWILSKTHRLIKEVTHAMDNYDTTTSCKVMKDFVNDLSTWYVRRSRNRLKEQSSSMTIFSWVLQQLVLVMAPFIPFTTEIIYQNLLNTEASVHLQFWPKYVPSVIDDDVEKSMEIARKLVEGIHSIRKERSIPVKQPLLAWAYEGKKKDLFSKYPQIIEIIAEEVNVRTLTSTDELAEFIRKPTVVKTTVSNRFTGEMTVFLDTLLTDELKTEREVRELIRRIQQLRKEKSVRVNELVDVEVPGRLLQYENYIKKQALVRKLIWGDNLKILDG